MSSDQIETLSALGFFYLVNGFADRAMIIFKALYLVDSKQPHILRALALSYARTNKPTEAINALDQLALKGDMDGPYHLLRSQVLMTLNRTSEGIAAMRAYVNACETNHKAVA